MLRTALAIPAALVAAALLTGTASAAVSPAATRPTAGRTAAQQARSFEQSQLNAISVRGAWQASRGQGVTVGVLDTGVDTRAPDLSGSVRAGPDFTVGADPAGYSPPHLHGTFIASVIAGHGSGPGRTQGVMGVAPAARVLSVRVILDDGEPGLARYNNDQRFASAIGKGIYYAVAHGVRVINMSLGSPQPTRFLRTAVGYAISHGVVVVASAGNSGSAVGGFTPYDYPASYTGVISVAALNANGTRAPFSDRNASVVLSAPGVNVVGDGAGGEFVEGDGTSPAAAFVTGVVALIRSRYPALSPALVEQALITAARHRPRRGYSTSVGFGEVNAAAALIAAGRLAATAPAAGLAPAAHFGPQSLAPIQVTHRDQALIAAYSAVSVVAALCFIAAVAFGVLLGRRVLRDRRRPPAAAPSWEQPSWEQAPWEGASWERASWEQAPPPPPGGSFLPRRGGPYGSGTPHPGGPFGHSPEG